MLSHRHLLAIAVPLALGVAPPALAKRAVFNVTVKGSQATTWHMERAPDPNLCGAAQHADGDQMIRFASAKPERIVVTQKAGQRPSFSASPTVNATAQRSGEFQMDAVVGGRTGCTGIIHMPPVPQTGCGERAGTVSISLAYSAGTDDPDLAPLVPARNHLRLRGADANFGGGPLFDAYQSCPLMVAPTDRPESRGEPLEVIQAVTESRLFDKHRKVLKISAGRVEKLSFGQVTGRTAVAYNVTLKRVR